MKTILTTGIAAATVILTLSPAGAMPDPEPAYVPSAEVAEINHPFGAGHAPVRHEPGHDWLPARR